MKGLRSCFHQDETKSQQKSDRKGRALGCDPRDRVDFPGGSEGKASACNAGDPASIPESGRSPGEGNGNPL